MRLEIRRLSRDDDRSGFSCGQPDLDRFFQHYAGQNQFKLHVAVTYVAIGDGRIVGFATVTVGSLERKDTPGAKLRRRLPAYPLPVLRLARFGVDTRAQGQGVGRALLRCVLQRALSLRDALGCVGVLVDAKAEAVPFYHGYGFSELTDVHEGQMHGDTTALFLPMATLVAALSD